MNTNSNVYTVVYTTIVVVVVAAVLAFAAMQFKPRQIANVKAETLSQMMAAAQLGQKEELSAMGNDAVLAKYAENIDKAFTVDLSGKKVRDLSTDVNDIEVIDNLKPQDKNIKAASANAELPVYVFKSGVTVIPIYGAGLWGPVWGYAAFNADGCTLAGAYFDHASETPGLGAKIKDEPCPSGNINKLQPDSHHHCDDDACEHIALFPVHCSKGFNGNSPTIDFRPSPYKLYV